MNKRSTTTTIGAHRLYLTIACLLALASGSWACSTGTFSLVPNLGGPTPTNISGHSLSAYSGNNKLYVFGGVNQNFAAGVNTFHNTLSSFDAVANAWALVDSGTGPSVRAFHSAVVATAGSNPTLLVIGGTNFTADGSHRILYKGAVGMEHRLRRLDRARTSPQRSV